MKAGTAQKAALNLFSTALMVRLGRIYRGRMVYMQARNAKLRARAVRMMQELTSCSAEQAQSALAGADGKVKLAILLLRGMSRADAEGLLERFGGNLRQALQTNG